MHFSKRKLALGRKRKFAEQKAIEWYQTYEGLTEEEAEIKIQNKNIKKTKKRKPLRGQKKR